MSEPLDFIIRDCPICKEQTFYKHFGVDGVPWRLKYVYGCIECSHRIELEEDDFTADDRRNARR